MSAASCFAKGWRTLAAVAAFCVTGFLSVIGTLDLTPLVQLFVKDPAMLGVAMLGVGALFGWLRYISTTPIGKPADPYASLAGADSERVKIDAGS